ncbi:hypothetical protein PRIPAC_78802, partial [Pristionchus pacificus]|uniref:Uncharacterized protein n=1 Tax=Pristionchus pacificus TaxID=54126 RepID=A0A2A6CJA6_PRIPA
TNPGLKTNVKTATCDVTTKKWVFVNAAGPQFDQPRAENILGKPLMIACSDMNP